MAKALKLFSSLQSPSLLFGLLLVWLVFEEKKKRTHGLHVTYPVSASPFVPQPFNISIGFGPTFTKRVI